MAGVGTRLNVGSQQFELSWRHLGLLVSPAKPLWRGVCTRTPRRAVTVTWPAGQCGGGGWAGLLAETKGLQNPRALIAPRARVNIPISNYVYNSGGVPAHGDGGAAPGGGGGGGLK